MRGEPALNLALTKVYVRCIYMRKMNGVLEVL